MLARKLTVVVVLAALGLSACGSSSKSAGSNSGTTATTTAGSQPSSGDTATTAKPSGNGGGGGGDGSSFCGLMRKDDNAFKGADVAAKSATDLKSLYANIIPELDRAESKAPDAIKSDFATLASGIKTLAKALAAANYDVTKLNPASFKDLADAKFETASQNITAYLTQHCGLKAG